MERHFFSNLVAREIEEEKRAPINQRFANHLLERDLHLAEFEVRPNSPSMGKTLIELNFRQKCNVNIVTIIRGNKRINIPGGKERLYPYDQAGLIQIIRRKGELLSEEYQAEGIFVKAYVTKDIYMKV